MNDQSQNFDDALIDAVDALEREDYETAYKLFLPLAEQGCVDGQSNLGWMYYNGRGVPQDKKEAEKWWKLAAEQKDDFAQSCLGFMHFKEAEKWWRLAAEQGNASAQCSLGEMHYGGEGVPQDYAEAIRLWKLAAEQGDEEAQYNLDNYA